jgi:hypothetical protein
LIATFLVGTRPIKIPPFLHGLSKPDDYSGAVRAEMMRQAVDAGNAHRVVAFYRGFLAEAGRGAPAQHVSRSRSGAPSGNIYTRQQIASLYERHRKGEISDARWPQIEADIVRAGAEGRVVGAMNLTDGTAVSRLTR